MAAYSQAVGGVWVVDSKYGLSTLDEIRGRGADDRTNRGRGSGREWQQKWGFS